MRHPSKAQGLDGFYAAFYQWYWSIIGNDIITLALNFLNDGGMVEDIDKTYMVLILKVKNANKMMDFRPINLCNVLYIILAKMIANRLKSVFPSIIGES